MLCFEFNYYIKMSGMKNNYKFYRSVLREISPIFCNFYRVETKNPVDFCESLFGFTLAELIEFYFYELENNHTNYYNNDQKWSCKDSVELNCKIHETNNGGVCNLIRLSINGELDFPTDQNVNLIEDVEIENGNIHTTLKTEKNINNKVKRYFIIQSVNFTLYHNAILKARGYKKDKFFNEMKEKFNDDLSNLSCDYKLRESLYLKLNKNISEFDKRFYKFLFLILPLSFIEGFSSAKKHSSYLSNQNRKNLFITSKSIYNCDFFKISYLISSLSRGSKLVVFQHGGSDFKKAYLKKYNLHVADYFMCWSMSHANETENAYPLFPVIFLKLKLYYFLSFFKINNRIEKKQVVIGQQSKLMNDRIMYEFLPDFENFQLNKKKYLRNLDYLASAGGKNISLRLKSEFSIVQLSFDVHVSRGTREYANTLRNWELCIVTYLATTYIETLYLNIPTVINYNEELYSFDDFMKPIVDKLIACKIIHKSFKEMIDFVNSVENIEIWWHSREVQSARKMFLNEIPPVTSIFSGFNQIITHITKYD